MSTDLDGALPQSFSFKKTVLHCSVGSNKGYFVGLGPKYQERSMDPCRACAGARSIEGEPCRACEGSGKKTTTKVPILWQLSPDGPPELEWVTYALSAPGKLANGKPKSASTLFVRFRVLSGGLTDPGEIAKWYKELPKPPRIPVELMVLDKESVDGVYIAQVRLLKPRASE